eukprot:336816_1
MAFIRHGFLSIIVTAISIAAYIVIYQLYIYLCCCQTKTKTDESKNAVSSSSVSKSGSNSNSSNKSKSSTNKPHEINAFFRYTTLITATLFFVTCVSVTIDRILILVYLQRTTNVFDFFVWPSYFIGRIVLSLIFIGRLYFTFLGSTFQYSKCTIRSLIFTWFLMPCCTCLSITLTIIPYTRIIGIIVATLIILIDIVLSFILLYLYARKLFVLMSKQDTILISVMTRYALLYTLCFISTLTVFAAISIQAIILSLTSSPPMTSEDIYIFISIDSFTNMLCVLLNLVFAKRWYNKLCRHLDDKCKLCCKYCTNDSIEHQNMITTKNVQMTQSSSKNNEVQTSDVSAINWKELPKLEIVSSNSTIIIS